MPWKCLEDIFARRLEDTLKTSCRRLQNVLKTSWEDILKTSQRRLEDVWPRWIYWSWPRRFEDILKTSSENLRHFWKLSALIKTSWGCLKDVFLRRKPRANIFVLIKTSWRRLEDVFWRRRRKTSSRDLQDVFIKMNVCWVQAGNLKLSEAATGDVL